MSSETGTPKSYWSVIVVTIFGLVAIVAEIKSSHEPWTTVICNIVGTHRFFFGALLFIYTWSIFIRKDNVTPPELSKRAGWAVGLLHWFCATCIVFNWYFLGLLNADSLSRFLRFDVSWLHLEPHIDLAFECVISLAAFSLLVNKVRGTWHSDKTDITLWFIVIGIVGGLANHLLEASVWFNIFLILLLYALLFSYFIHRELSLVDFVMVLPRKAVQLVWEALGANKHDRVT
jgi:hypothetical protein